MSYLLDANILLYAFRRAAPQHAVCLAWLTGTLNRGEIVYASAVVELALLRISTLPKLGPQAAAPADVFAFLQTLHAVPNYLRLELDAGESEPFERLAGALSLRGNDLNDAYLAALALTNDLTLVTADSGFARFPGLKLHNPV